MGQGKGNLKLFACLKIAAGLLKEKVPPVQQRKEGSMVQSVIPGRYLQLVWRTGKRRSRRWVRSCILTGSAPSCWERANNGEGWFSRSRERQKPKKEVKWLFYFVQWCAQCSTKQETVLNPRKLTVEETYITFQWMILQSMIWSLPGELSPDGNIAQWCKISQEMFPIDETSISYGWLYVVL